MSSDQAIRHLKQSDKRHDLITSYKYFLNDGNREIYAAFVESSIKKRRHVYDSIEIANLTEYYSDSFLAFLRRVIKGRNVLNKLAALDYLISNHLLIAYDQYVFLNHLASKHTRSELVELQASINLLFSKDDVASNTEKVFKVLINRDDPGFFYRAINNFLDFKFDDSIAIEFRKKINELIARSMLINNEQRIELLKMAKKIGK